MPNKFNKGSSPIRNGPPRNLTPPKKPQVKGATVPKPRARKRQSGGRRGLKSLRAAKSQNHGPAEFIAVNDGRTCLGWIAPKSKSSFEGHDANGRLIGIFRTKTEAVTAIWSAQRGPGERT